MKTKLSVLSTKLGLLLLLVLTASRATCGSWFNLPAVTPQPLVTNRYHLKFLFDTSNGATGYAIIVRTNNNEAFRCYSATNSIIVSNLSANIDQYQFTAIATNLAGESAESLPALSHSITVMESDTVNGPWTLLATNQFMTIQAQHFIMLSNWSAQSFLLPD